MDENFSDQLVVKPYGPFLGMLLVVLCLILLIGLMVVLRTCCHCDKTQPIAASTIGHSNSSNNHNTVVVSVITQPTTPQVPSTTGGRENHGFVDIEMEPPPSYEEAMKLPRHNNPCWNHPSPRVRCNSNLCYFKKKKEAIHLLFSL